MAKFYVMTKRGTYPPTFLHESIDSAVTEATRLHHQLKDDVMILEVVGEVKLTAVPVTTMETKITLKDGIYQENEDLPF